MIPRRRPTPGASLELGVGVRSICQRRNPSLATAPQQVKGNARKLVPGLPHIWRNKNGTSFELGAHALSGEGTGRGVLSASSNNGLNTHAACRLGLTLAGF